MSSNIDVPKIIASYQEIATQLEEEKTKIEAVLGQLGDGVVVCDAQGTVIMMNEAAEKIVGFPLSQVLGTSMIDTHPPGYRPFVASIMKQLSDSKPEEGFFWEQNIHLPGNKVVRIHMRPVFLKNGTFIGIATVMQDITEMVELEQAKSEFISTVAHELKTPLTALKGSLGLILGEAVGEIEPGLRELMGIAQNNCNRLIRLVNDMLDLAKIESGHLSLEMDIVSVQERVTSAVKQIRPCAQDRGVSVGLRLVGNPRSVVGDGDRIEQVVTNFLWNAIKFTPEGGSVEVVVRQVRGNVKVSVTDHGPGIPTKEQKRIFEKFYQVQGLEPRGDRGSGLGLAISKGLIEQHGGTTGVKSTVGEGSTFSFSLPIPGEDTLQADD